MLSESELRVEGLRAAIAARRPGEDVWTLIGQAVSVNLYLETGRHPFTSVVPPVRVGDWPVGCTPG